MPEEEIVRRILNACNPSLASGLRGIVTTVDQVVKLGSLIEKDWSNSTEYWSQIQQANPPDRSSKKPTRSPEFGRARGPGADVGCYVSPCGASGYPWLKG